MPRAVRYRILRKIAHGGMAEIFLALQTGAEGFQKPVVLKRILPAFAADPHFVRMLVDEAHIASSLNHSHLVQVLDLGKSGGQFFLVLEFVDGWSLEQVRRRAQKARLKFPLPLALYIVSSLCRGLQYVHQRERDGKPLGIVHRDVSPQNVLLGREGEVKLADFGIAKAVGRREKSATGDHQGQVRVHVAGAVDRRRARRAIGSVLGRHAALHPDHRAQALRRADRRRGADAGAPGALREADRVEQGVQPRGRALHRARAARRSREALAVGRADGGSARRDPDQAGAGEWPGGAEALARRAERARRRAGRRATSRRRRPRRRSVRSSSRPAISSCTTRGRARSPRRRAARPRAAMR